jgi:hypothetical protein
MNSNQPPPSRSHRPLSITLWIIAIFQFLLGAAFLFAPSATASALDLATAPGWANWMFAMMGARFIGFGVGMVAAARNPSHHRLWIEIMIGIQAIDWLATLVYLAKDDVTLGQVTTAAFVPVLFVIALMRWRPRTSAPAEV